MLSRARLLTSARRHLVGAAACQRSVLQACSMSSVADDAMFDKILIANRGEIACRVMETARRMGVRTVAVYSDADANAKHVAMADEAFRIGPPPAAESYLRGDALLDIAARSGAQAIHPGYGFLSENEVFATACAEAGVKFIGPPAAAIRDMGSKSASKDIMIAAGVPVTPGYHGEDQSFETLSAEADKIGYPVLIKAVLGGGGKGMRVVQKPEDLQAMLDACRREALASFSDDRVLIEKFLIKPRHVELQVFADQYGNAVHLFERDCSVQRRHQKVLEEAPAPGMDPELRARMGDSAVAAAKAVGYEGAGTVEFIFGQDSTYYFMEMNTRLQVEHPVTELVTGQDLVEWQLMVAAGHALPMRQDELTLSGHALEARVYAENAAKDFLPQTGRIVHMRPPANSRSVRIDTGVRQGDEVSIYYDPMISKLITYGANRGEALRQMVRALEQYQVVGLNTNIDFLRACVLHPAFQKGGVDTGFLETHMDEVLPKDHVADTSTRIIGALGVIFQDQLDQQAAAAGTNDSTSPWNSGTGSRPSTTTMAQRTITLLDGEHELSCTVTRTGADEFVAQIDDGTAVDVTASPAADGRLHVAIGDQKHTVTVVYHANSVHIFAEGNATIPYARFKLPMVDFAAAGGMGNATVVTPMPGKVIQMNVEAGQTVEEGDALLIIEAMKMEHVIRAPRDGILESVNCDVDDFVEDGKVLVAFKADEE